MTVFAHGRKIATNVAERGRSRGTAKAVRDFLLHFHHADIALGPAVVEGNRKVVHKGEHLILLKAQPLQEIADHAMLDSALPILGSRCA